MTQNLLRDTWADLDQADLRLLLDERIGRPGQYDGKSDVLHLPLAREKCRISLTFKGAKIVAIKAGPAFDQQQWEQICAEIEGPLLKGPRRVGREFSLSTCRVEGWWRGARSGIQILPAPSNAPRGEGGADDPFILEFPIQDAGLSPITLQRRTREHRKLTRLLNLVLAGHTSFLPDRRRSFWACVKFDAEPEFKWVQEWYFADLNEGVTNELSSPTGDKLVELEPEKYYGKIGKDGLGLRVPSDLDEVIVRYQQLQPKLQAKFDRATTG